MATLHSKWLALIGSALIGAASAAFAQDSGPLIDLLVKKGIVNDQEAETLRAELVKDFAANTSAGKLNLSSSLAEFKLSGDVRIREQAEWKYNQPTTPTGQTFGSDNQDRTRFRFRLNGDVKLQKGWGGGFALETGSSADSGNESFTNGAADYSIYLARAYISYQPTNEFLVVAGKQRNPYYTTDLLWDADINPQGFFESYTFNFDAKNSLELRVGQWIMKDNSEYSSTTTSAVDSWVFEQQLVYTSKFGHGHNFIVAPGVLFYNASNSGTAFTGEAPFNGSTRGLKLITLPVEVNFANVLGAGSQLKVYGDFVHNTEAGTRVYRVYGLSKSTVSEDADAWLLGVGYAQGTGKLQGDWSVKLDYRNIGIGSIDPNINDSDFAFSMLNQKGAKFAASYNLTDFALANLTFFATENKRSTLYYSPLSTLGGSKIIQADIVVKF